MVVQVEAVGSCGAPLPGPDAVLPLAMDGPEEQLLPGRRPVLYQGPLWMGTPEDAPQASAAATCGCANALHVLVLQHEAGDGEDTSTDVRVFTGDAGRVRGA